MSSFIAASGYVILSPGSENNWKHQDQRLNVLYPQIPLLSERKAFRGIPE